MTTIILLNKKNKSLIISHLKADYNHPNSKVLALCLIVFVQENTSVAQ